MTKLFLEANFFSFSLKSDEDQTFIDVKISPNL